MAQGSSSTEDFPWLTDEVQTFPGAFRDNIKAFLRDHAAPVPGLELPNVSAWTAQLRCRDTSVRLQIYEEQISEQKPVFCDSCRIIGWQHHPVCARKYHFIIPAHATPEAAAVHGNIPALVEIWMQGSCKKPLRLPRYLADDAGSPFVAPVSIFDSTVHLLHGVLHANGFGHLLRINGLEGGSQHATGRQLMNLWDHLCTLLRARVVSTEDVSSKAGMELRLLHTVAHRQTWYGRWGFLFGRGGFAIGKQAWRRAMDAVANASLDALLEDFAGSDPGLSAIVERFKASKPAKAGNTLGALLQRLLYLLSHPDKAASALQSHGVPAPPIAQPGASCIPPALPESTRKRSKRKAEPDEAASPHKKACTIAKAPKAELAAELDGKKGSLEVLSGRWWRKRWSRHKAEAAMEQLLRLLQSEEGQWVAKEQLREKLMARVCDRPLVEVVLSTAPNKLTSQGTVFRDEHPNNGQEFLMLARSDFGLKHDHLSNGRPDSAQQAQQQPKTVCVSPSDAAAPLPNGHASAGNAQGGECGCRENGAAALGAMLQGSQHAAADDMSLVLEHVNGTVSPAALGCGHSLSPWGNRKGRNLRPPSPAKGGSWSARRFVSLSPEELLAAGGHALRSHQTQSEAAAAGMTGLPHGPKASDVAAAMHAQQPRCSGRPRRAQNAPQQMEAAAVIKAALGRADAALSVPSCAGEISPSRLRGGPQVDYNETKHKGSSIRLQAAALRQRAATAVLNLASAPPTPAKAGPWLDLTPGARFTPTEGYTVRDQLLCDLLHVFEVTLRAYKPLQLADTRAQSQGGPCACEPEQACSCAPAARPKLSHLQVDAQVLRDVKHFVKNYSGEEALAAQGDAAHLEPMVRLLVQVQLPQKESQLPTSPSAAKQQSSAPRSAVSVSPKSTPKRRPIRKRALANPPPELLCVPQRATAAALRAACTQTMRTVYRMLHKFQVDEVEGVQHGSQVKGKVGSMQDGTVITVQGHGIDVSPVWRHSGGMEEWHVACMCGTRDDDGERMIACDGCGEWSHTRCAGYPDSLPSPDHFVCAHCSSARKR